MKLGGFPRQLDPLKRLARPAGAAVVLAFIGITVFLSRDWFRVFVPGRRLFRNSAAALLKAILTGYLVALAVTVFGVMLSAWAVARSKRHGADAPGWWRRRKAARWLLLCGSSLLAMIMAEAVSAARLAWLHRLPALPVRFTDRAGSNDELFIVVIGESSALGVPYEGWLSLGTIVERKLRLLIPSHRFRVEVLAEKGATLEAMHLKLAGLTRRPDALIVYSGHNEFLARYSLWNRVAFYEDDASRGPREGLLRAAGRLSPLIQLARENLEKQQVGTIPARSLGDVETVVGRPVCTAADAGLVLADFQLRLEAMVVDCERIGCLPILIIPPGNDASDPTQSYATPATRINARRALFRRLQEIRSLEERAPSDAIAAYQEILAQQPTHAHVHHRLARLLQSAGLFSDAERHFILARDHDGLPMRCTTALEAAYRLIAQRHERNVVIVDGPAVLKARSRRGILDNDLFHDNVHPNLKGYVALAEAVLTGLKARAAFDWPESTPAPVLDARRVAGECNINAAAWAAVCWRSAAHYGQLAFLTNDSAERIAWRDRYARTARRIEAGAAPEDTGIPGLENREKQVGR